MSATYNEVLQRLIEERKRFGLSQKEMAQIVHITQSNYSKVKNGLYRLSYEELKYLSRAQIDVCYIFTGYRSVGKYVEKLQQHTYAELLCFLGIIYSLIVLNVVVIRNVTGIRQKPMAEKLGVDIKKFCELEKLLFRY